MIKTTTYGPGDFKSGTCSSCGEYSDEIVRPGTRCAECIFDQQFFESTMKDDDDDDDDDDFDEEE